MSWWRGSRDKQIACSGYDQLLSTIGRVGRRYIVLSLLKEELSSLNGGNKATLCWWTSWLTNDGDGSLLGRVDNRLQNTLSAFAEVVPFKDARRSIHAIAQSTCICTEEDLCINREVRRQRASTFELARVRFKSAFCKELKIKFV